MRPIDGGETLVLYRVSPDTAVKRWFTDHINMTGIKAQGLNCNVVQGYPLYAEGANQSGADRGFPRLGIAHAGDTDVQDSGIGAGFCEFHPAAFPAFQELLQNFKQLPEHERIASDAVIDAISQAVVVQRWIELVESTVVIAGFASGGGAWLDNRRLYNSVAGQLKPLQHDIQEHYEGVKVVTEDRREADLEYTDAEHGLLFGFEIAIRIRQPRRTFRALPHYKRPGIESFDIHMEESGTQWGPIEGTFHFRT
jgi:hypothetical protein